ncbi:YihA family ribosome biogenesis GTP-binding protein [Patescibacteria group bacterium]|nr:YihA family ribosome biogenesis GTP-binding protein [Patescibacteria group bacterium]
MKNMEISTVEFVKGVVGEDPIMHDNVTQIAFVGRSNVGKSSTLNAILGKSRLVKVGKTPGKTQEINFFKLTINNGLKMYCVDLPGYGYAKLSKKRREELRELIEWYISYTQAPIALICLIIDAKVGLTDLDKVFLQHLQQSGKKYIVAANKIDKINQKEQHQLKKELSSSLGVDVFYYSVLKRKNIDVLKEAAFSIN